MGEAHSEGTTALDTQPWSVWLAGSWDSPPLPSGKHWTPTHCFSRFWHYRPSEETQGSEVGGCHPPCCPRTARCPAPPFCPGTTQHAHSICYFGRTQLPKKSRVWLVWIKIYIPQLQRAFDFGDNEIHPFYFLNIFFAFYGLKMGEQHFQLFQGFKITTSHKP